MRAQMDMNARQISGPHPSSEALAGYACEPQSPRYADVAQHVSGCVRCQKEAAATVRMVAGLRELGAIETSVAGGTHLCADDINAFVAAAGGSKQAQWQQHVESCGPCRRNVLLQRARSASSGTVPTPMHAEARVDKVISLPRVIQRRVPIWGVVPASLAAGVLFAVGLHIWWPVPSSSITVAAYRDDARIFYIAPNDQPGLGFFAGAAQRAEPYAGLVADVRDGRLHLKWAAVTDASGYELRISTRDADTQKTIFQQQSRATEVALDVSLMDVGVRYEWELLGACSDGTKFSARGGFVLAQ